MGGGWVEEEEVGWEEVYVEGGGEGRIMEYGGQKSRGAGFGLWWGCERDKEEGTKQLGWSLSLTSLPLISRVITLSHLSPCPRVWLSQSFVLFGETEREIGRKRREIF